MTKETNIIVLHVKVDSNVLVSSHSYEIAPSNFEVPISAICCQERTVVAASLDGKTQYFQIGNLIILFIFPDIAVHPICE